MNRSIITLSAVVCLLAYPLWRGIPSIREEPASPVNNLVLLIGDGMGPQQLSLALLYAKYAPSSTVPHRSLHIERLMKEGVSGLVYTSTGDYGLVVESACAATQLATGRMCTPGTLGVDDSGMPVTSIVDLAQAAGKGTGLVSDTRITHATPAAFAVHHGKRKQENEIAELIIQSKVHLLLSGGLAHFLPQEVNDPLSPEYRNARALVQGAYDVYSMRKDSRNLVDEARLRGFNIIFNRTQLSGATGEKPILGLFSPEGMPDGITYSQSRLDHTRTVPSLSEMTAKALDILSRNPNGFFLMVEGGQIDWACHSNDTGLLLHEMLKFDEAIGTVLDWAKERDDTLVVLTADHETGSFGLSYLKDATQPQSTTHFGDPRTLDKIYGQKRSLKEPVTSFLRESPSRQTPQRLSQLVNSALMFPLSAGQAEKLLAMKPHPSIVHFEEMGEEERPPSLVYVFPGHQEYYPDIEDNLVASIAWTISPSQGVVWGTGTHTATPVIVTATGHEESAKQFSGIWHTTDIGTLIRRSLALDDKSSFARR